MKSRGVIKEGVGILIGALTGATVQLLLIAVASSLLLLGKLSEGNIGFVTLMVRLIAVFFASYIGGRVVKENKVAVALLSAAAMIAVWFAAALCVSGSVRPSAFVEVLSCLVPVFMAIMLILRSKGQGKRGYKKSGYC